MEMAAFGSVVEAVSHRFAVDGDELVAEFAVDFLDESDEASVEFFGVNGRKNTSESVVARHPVREFEEFFKPRFFEFSEALHVVKALALANDGGQCDEEDFAKIMPLVSTCSRVV